MPQDALVRRLEWLVQLFADLTHAFEAVQYCRRRLNELWDDYPDLRDYMKEPFEALHDAYLVVKKYQSEVVEEGHDTLQDLLGSSIY